MGLGARAVAELAALELPADPAEADAQPLRDAAEAGDPEAARAAARALHKAHPGHPEWLVPLWHPSLTGPRVVQERRRLLDRVDRSLDEPVVALRVHRLHWEIGVPSEAVDTRAAALAPLPFRPLSDVERHRVAEAGFPGPRLPSGLEARTALDVALRLHRMLVDAHRPDDAVALWAAHPELAATPEALVARAQLTPAPDTAWTWLATPTPHDRAAADPAAWTVRPLLQARARTQAPVDAWSALLLASLLPGEADAPATEDALDRARRGFPLPDPRAARAALAAADDADALVRAFDAALAATLGPVPARRDLLAHPEGWREAVGALATLATERAVALEAPREVLAFGALTEALLGRPAGHTLARATAHEALGHRDAAFHGLAHARAEGAPVEDARLRATYDGLGDAVATADALAGPPGSRPSGPAIAPLDAAALLGTRPDWAEAGLDPDALTGRWTLLSLWDSGCGGCLDSLGQAAATAGQLRRDLRDVASLAVSTDRDPEAFERAARLSRSMGTVARSPGMTKTLDLAWSGVTLLVDPEGIVRVVNPSGLSLGEIEAAMHGVAPH